MDFLNALSITAIQNNYIQNIKLVILNDSNESISLICQHTYLLILKVQFMQLKLVFMFFSSVISRDFEFQSDFEYLRFYEFSRTFNFRLIRIFTINILVTLNIRQTSNLPVLLNIRKASIFRWSTHFGKTNSARLRIFESFNV